MLTEAELTGAIANWLERFDVARELSALILKRADSTGEIAKEFSTPFDRNHHNALAALFSTENVKQSRDGSKTRVRFRRWEGEQVGCEGLFLQVLARLCDYTLTNRRQHKEHLENILVNTIEPFVGQGGLVSHVAQRELEAVRERKGRFWSRAQKYEHGSSQIERYFRLLQFVDDLRSDPDRIESIVHISRLVAGDTHWFRPGNRIWRDLATDVLECCDVAEELESEVSLRQRRAKALSMVGITENLTSILVMAFGNFRITRDGTQWSWPIEAAQQQMPVWLSARHLIGATLEIAGKIKSVICVENETSFLDLIAHANPESTICVYTEGSANRAVVLFLRMLAESNRDLKFEHQGDLDLGGVRILNSLTQRSGLIITPLNMDASTHARFREVGIGLTDKEKSSMEKFIAQTTRNETQCYDLLEEILCTRTRIEQEVITAECVARNNDNPIE